MRTFERNVGEIAFRTFISIVFCALFGWFTETAFTARLHIPYQFIAFGALGAVFFHTLRLYRLKSALATLLFSLFIISTLFLRSHGIAHLRNAVVALASAIALHVYLNYFYHHSKPSRLLEPLVVAVLFGMANFIAILIAVPFYGTISGIGFRWVAGTLEEWFLIGLGIGLGILLTEDEFKRVIPQWFRDMARWISSPEKSH